MTTDARIGAKKSLGQNFLVNRGVLSRIVASADIRPGDIALEIGPGTGTLTAALAQAGARVIAVEKDRRLVPALQERFKDETGVQIVEGDILKWNPEDFDLHEGSYKVVANIPYYLTSHLVRLMLASWPAPERCVLMVQAEVAQRLMARPPEMNLLALAVQLYAKPTLVMRVSRGSFRPQPNVDSAVILLEPLPGTGRSENERVLALAKRAFAHKRKQLASSLPESALRDATIMPSARPQELSLEQWRALASALP